MWNLQTTLAVRETGGATRLAPCKERLGGLVMVLTLHVAEGS